MRSHNQDTAKIAETIMAGDKATEGEQTKSDEAAFRSAPNQTQEIHSKSSKERTKRSIARCFTTGIVAVSAIVAGTIIVCKTLSRSVGKVKK